MRRAVALNEATPSQADVVLAKDGSVDVRIALAKRLMDLLPNISESKQAQLYSYAVNALGTLARDEVLKVRIALSTILKDKTYTPPQVASQLARDAEQEVAEPMLRFCVALSDDDLLEIISGHPAPWVLTAIASRDVVNELVSDAIIDVDELESSTHLFPIMVHVSAKNHWKSLLKKPPAFLSSKNLLLNGHHCHLHWLRNWHFCGFFVAKILGKTV